MWLCLRMISSAKEDFLMGVTISHLHRLCGVLYHFYLCQTFVTSSDLYTATGIEDCFSITVLLIGVCSGKQLHNSTWNGCCLTSFNYLRVCWMITSFNCMLLEVCYTCVWQYARITSICVCHPEVSPVTKHSIIMSLHILLPDDTSNMAKRY